MKYFSRKNLWVVIWSLWVTSVAADPQASVANVVMGGAERRCSSYDGAGLTRNCAADWVTILRDDPALVGLTLNDISFTAQVATPNFTYGLTQTRLDAFKASPDRLFDPVRKAAVLTHLAGRLAALGSVKTAEWPKFEATVFPLEVQRALGLSNSEMAVLRTALVDPSLRYQRLREVRSLKFSSNRDTVEIYSRFVAAASAVRGGQRPRIGVVTASADPHAFADRDLNVTALQSAGSDAVYVPIDVGMRQALDADDCANLRYYAASAVNRGEAQLALHHDLMFADMAQQQRALCENHGAGLNALLAQLDGIYFSGGNQARHLESFASYELGDGVLLPSEQYKILQTRHAAGELVVAGSSAGNHFQGGGVWQGKRVPMIGGGDSYAVLTTGYEFVPRATGPASTKPSGSETGDESVHAPKLFQAGGLGVFRFGVLDSHFSERAREARLIRATLDGAMDYGFGVDENTALLVSRADEAGSTHLSVVGAGGVFLADVRQATQVLRPDNLAQIRGVRAHYLQAGDRALIDSKGALQVSLSPQRVQLSLRPQPAWVTQDKLLDYGAGNFMRLAASMGRTGAALGYGTTEHSLDRRGSQNRPHYSATLSRDGDTEFRGEANLATPTGGGVSYTHLQVQLSPCSGPCQLPVVSRCGTSGERC